MIDEETKALAALALRNAFWKDFSDLVNTYLGASNGLDIQQQTVLMGELTSIYGRDPAECGGFFLNIWTRDGVSGTTGHNTILDALCFEPATSVHVQSKRVFEKRNEEWVYLDA